MFKETSGTFSQVSETQCKYTVEHCSPAILQIHLNPQAVLLRNKMKLSNTCGAGSLFIVIGVWPLIFCSQPQLRRVFCHNPSCYFLIHLCLNLHVSSVQVILTASLVGGSRLKLSVMLVVVLAKRR